jgi:hypothetical protein
MPVLARTTNASSAALLTSNPTRSFSASSRNFNAIADSFLKWRHKKRASKTIRPKERPKGENVVDLMEA